MLNDSKLVFLILVYYIATPIIPISRNGHTCFRVRYNLHKQKLIKDHKSSLMQYKVLKF